MFNNGKGKLREWRRPLVGRQRKGREEGGGEGGLYVYIHLHYIYRHTPLYGLKRRYKRDEMK